MADALEVIDALSVCSDQRNPAGYRFTSENECPYFKYKFDDGPGCVTRLIRDAMDLLKEQEPVEPVIGGNQNSCWYFICSRCQLAIDKGDKYCRHCGRAVKWDG